jgi:hypothetical protein
LFERFTERARQVVVLAQDEARALRHNYLGTAPPAMYPEAKTKGSERNAPDTYATQYQRASP